MARARVPRSPHGIGLSVSRRSSSEKNPRPTLLSPWACTCRSPTEGNVLPSAIRSSPPMPAGKAPRRYQSALILVPEELNRDL